MNKQITPRLAGVRLTRSGPLVLVDAGTQQLAVGDEALVEVTGKPDQETADVAVTPEQLVSAGGSQSAGRVIGKTVPVAGA